MKEIRSKACGLLCLCLMLSLPVVRAQRSSAAKQEISLRVMSYNVKGCAGMDNVTDYQRTADVICRADPDVVAIQELDSATKRSGGVFVLRELAERCLMHYTYGAAIDYQGGKYGIGILSKRKPLSFRTLHLPGREEARALLIAEFDDYVFCCTHLSLTPEDQLLSIPIIAEAMKGVKKPVFLAGDMNSVPDSPTQKALRKVFLTLSDARANTFPADKPDSCIDYIYGLNNGSLYSVLKRQVPAYAGTASDHLPLLADVRLKSRKEDIIRTKPYLQNPTDNGLTVSWFTNVPAHGWVEYGTDRQLGERKETIVDGQVICNNKHHKIRLTGLKPGTTYYYRTCSREITLYEAYRKEFGETACSDICSFTTPPAGKADFTAIILNDLHKNNKVLDMLMDQVRTIDYDFVLFNGDCIDDPSGEDKTVDFLSYLNEKVGAEKRAVFYLRGNHEIRNSYSIQLRDLFDYVGDKTYGAFSWGDTRFVMLDCGEDKPDSTPVYYNLNNFNQLRADQVDFLREELGSKTYKKAVKKVLIHHIPIYGISQKNNYLPCRSLWEGQLKNAPFDISINAHMHSFAYHPKGSDGNNFPVVIGGGNRPETATVMILQKKGKSMTLTVLNTKGEKIQSLDL